MSGQARVRHNTPPLFLKWRRKSWCEMCLRPRTEGCGNHESNPGSITKIPACAWAGVATHQHIKHIVPWCREWLHINTSSTSSTSSTSCHGAGSGYTSAHQHIKHINTSTHQHIKHIVPWAGVATHQHINTSSTSAHQHIKHIVPWIESNSCSMVPGVQCIWNSCSIRAPHVTVDVGSSGESVAACTRGDYSPLPPSLTVSWFSPPFSIHNTTF